MIPFTDAHTHHIPVSPKEDVLCMADISLQILSGPENLPSGVFASSGIHPAKTQDTDFSFWRSNFGKYPFRAVGECGIDRSLAIPLEDQEKLFLRQAELSAELDLPLIIHCVRAFDRVAAVSARFGEKRPPWILHGFRANESIMKEMLKHGFFLSLSPQFVMNSPQVILFRDIPVLLETDDTGYEISEIFQTFCEKNSLDLSAVKQQSRQLFCEAYRL